MASYPGDPGDATVAAPASDHRIHQLIRAIRDLGVSNPSVAASVIISAGGAQLSLEQRERVLQAFAGELGWTSGSCA